MSPGTAGNIEVRSDTQLFAGYKNAPELNAQSFTPDGWFKTGDVGRVENDALTIVGRQKATIIVNAKKNSAEIDRRGAFTRERHSSVARCCRRGTAPGQHDRRTGGIFCAAR